MSVKFAIRRNAKTALAIIIGGMLVCVCGSVGAQGLVKSVDSIGITVSDIDRSVEFFSKVLNFEKVSDTEVAGAEYEQLVGVFGVRMRIVRMRLGGEAMPLTEYLAPQRKTHPRGSPR